MSRVHHPFSPSSLQAREASPCFQPRSTVTEAAERGTLQHTAAESEEEFLQLSDAEAQAVAQVKARVAELEAEYAPDGALFKEAYWPIDNEPFMHAGETYHGTTAGYADVVLVSPTQQRAHIFDCKFGRYAVEPAANNLQGIAYALGVLNEARKQGIRLREITVEFYAPHIEDTSKHTFVEAEFPLLYTRVAAVVHRSQAIDTALMVEPLDLALYQPTSSACTFCARLGTCEAVASLALNISGKYRPLTVPDDIRGFSLNHPSAAALGLAVAQTVKEWATEYRKRLTSKALDDPTFVPEGYRLDVRTPRKICDKAAFLDVANTFLTPEEILDCTDYPLTVFEARIESKAPRGGKSHVSDNFKAALEEARAVERATTPVVSLRMKAKSTNSND
jgi:hypothetical protein